MRLPFKLPAGSVALLYRGWIATLRYTYIDSARFKSNLPVIFCLWHDELFATPILRCGTPCMVLISPTRDGTYLTEALKKFDFKIVRGSSSRGGGGALHTLINGLNNDGYSIGITADGPRGPRHKVKPGLLWLAAKSGRPVVPVRAFYNCKKTFSSWDRFQLPMPFSHVTAVYGDPWYPRIDLDSSASLRSACRELEQKMEALGRESCKNQSFGEKSSMQDGIDR